MATDFKTDQLITDKLIVTGSTFLIYSSSVATDNSAGINASLFNRDTDIGTDTFVFISGSKNSKGTAIRGTSVFAGDVISSGSFTSDAISGSLTRLTTGISFIAASGSAIVSSASNGQITIGLGAIASAPPDGTVSFYHAASGSGYASWTCPYVYNGVVPTTGILFAPGKIYAVPFITPALGGTVDSMGTYMNLFAGQSGSLGIYANTSNTLMYPTTLLASGQIPEATPGGSYITTFNTPYTLPAGVVCWLAVQIMPNPGYIGCEIGFGNAILGYPQNGFTNTTYPWSHITVASAWVDGQGLASSFPVGGVYMAADAAYKPIIFIHYSA